MRKHGVSLAILTLSFLTAMIASMNSIVSYVSAQSEALIGLVQVGEKYIILSQNAMSMSDSEIDAELASSLSEIAEINQAFPQKLLTAHLKMDSANLTVTIRAVENIESYLKFNAANVNGAYAKGSGEANVGEILARTANLSVNAPLTLLIDGKTLSVMVAGVYRCQSPLDAGILIPLTAVNNLINMDSEFSIIEFTFKHGVDGERALTRLAENLPASVRILKVQQPGAFIQKMNMQTLTFLDAWSIIVYAVIAASSYIITARLTAESSHELAILKALGANRRQILTLIIACTATVAVLGSILGVALGLAGAQITSKILSWLQPAVEVAPFLRVEQALKTLMLTLASSILGCLHPAHKSARLGCVEHP